MKREYGYVAIKKNNIIRDIEMNVSKKWKDYLGTPYKYFYISVNETKYKM